MSVQMPSKIPPPKSAQSINTSIGAEQRTSNLSFWCHSRAKRRIPVPRRSSSSVVRYLARYFHGRGGLVAKRRGGEGSADRREHEKARTFLCHPERCERTGV